MNNKRQSHASLRGVVRILLSKFVGCTQRNASVSCSLRRERLEHSGRSTGRTTPEGMARTLAAMNAGRVRWLARLKDEARPVPCGRKKGSRNRSVEERERAGYERECHRHLRHALLRAQADRKACRAYLRQSVKKRSLRLRITPGARLEWPPDCPIGPTKNGRTFSAADGQCALNHPSVAAMVRREALLQVAGKICDHPAPTITA